VLCGREKISEPFFFTIFDLIYDAEIIKELKAEGIGEDEVKLAVDRRIKDNPLIDIDDVTKVRTEERQIRDIGKTLTDYNAFDTGIFLCTPALFTALEDSIAAGDASLSGGMRKLGEKGKALTFDIGQRNWIDVDDDAAFKRAREIFKHRHTETNL
ncbi:MAG: nucleotidyltransferase, partial [bacterium]|nr:nucleotidyltransferase [bacterium]